MKSAAVISVIVLTLFLGTVGAWAADVEQPRLKYRSKGSVCSCTSGMSEDDIRKAWEARFAKPVDALPAKGDEHPEFHGQKKGGLNEAQPR
jgi:hypothetical protein